MDTLLLIGLGLLGLSVLLVVLEAFVPSGGVIGIGALISAIAGIVFLFRYEPIWGAIGLLATAILGPMVFVFSIKMLPSTPIGRSMMGRSGEEIAQDQYEARKAQQSERSKLIDAHGVAITDMRPGGIIEIDGSRHDAIAQGGIIDRGTPVRVTKVEGISIQVQPHEA